MPRWLRHGATEATDGTVPRWPRRGATLATAPCHGGHAAVPRWRRHSATVATPECYGGHGLVPRWHPDYSTVHGGEVTVLRRPRNGAIVATPQCHGGHGMVPLRPRHGGAPRHGAKRPRHGASWKGSLLNCNAECIVDRHLASARTPTNIGDPAGLRGSRLSRNIICQVALGSFNSFVPTPVP